MSSYLLKKHLQTDFVIIISNKGKSVASLCHQVAAWVPDMVCKFYFVKSHQIGKNSTTTKAREKISTNLKSLDF